MKKLVIIDANAVIHRAFHALPALATSTGEQTGAVYGFLLFLFSSIKEFTPDFIVSAFDYPAPTFRHEDYKLYKATRQKAPDELYQQIPKVKEVLDSLDIVTIEKKGFEADDIIGTISKKALKDSADLEIIILTGDLDALQLINSNVKVYSLKRGVKEGILYDEKQVLEKYGFGPDKMVDFKSLRGDPSDNIPGVRGIGEKSASELIKKYDSLENVYDNLGEIRPALTEKLKSGKEMAFVSKKLSQIKTDVPISFDLQKCTWRGYNKDKAVKKLKEYNFNSLIKRIENLDKKKNLTLL